MTAEPENSVRRRPRRLSHIRPWVQTAFLAVWLAPVSAVQNLPGCVFHCYGCPWSSFACPIGLMANYAALGPTQWAVAPLLLAGVLLAAGGLVGSLICGWACPFGYLQDLLERIPLPKFRIPNSLGLVRYAVLLGLVIALPWWLGSRGVPYERQSISICRVCPAGGLEASLPYSIQGLIQGRPWPMGPLRMGVIVVFLAAAVTTFRPWCKVFCPLGGLLSLFNGVSLFHLRFRREACIDCNTCRSHCSIGVEVERRVNVSHCIRCLECTTCGAIQPSIGGAGLGKEEHEGHE